MVVLPCHHRRRRCCRFCLLLLRTIHAWFFVEMFVSAKSMVFSRSTPSYGLSNFHVHGQNAIDFCLFAERMCVRLLACASWVCYVSIYALDLWWIKCECGVGISNDTNNEIVCHRCCHHTACTHTPINTVAIIVLTPAICKIYRSTRPHNTFTQTDSSVSSLLLTKFYFFLLFLKLREFFSKFFVIFVAKIKKSQKKGFNFGFSNTLFLPSISKNTIRQRDENNKSQKRM